MKQPPTLRASGGRKFGFATPIIFLILATTSWLLLVASTATGKSFSLNAKYVPPPPASAERLLLGTTSDDGAEQALAPASSDLLGRFARLLSRLHSGRSNTAAAAPGPLPPAIGSDREQFMFGAILVENLTIGTPPQSFSVFLDTVISELWVLDSTSNVSKLAPKKRLYNAGASSTASASDTSRVFNASGLHGTIADGPVVNETVTLAGLTLAPQEIGRAVNYQKGFLTLPVEGILGLGWPALSATGVKGPFFGLLNQLDAPALTIYIDPDASLFTPVSAQITFGAADHKNCGDDSSAVYAPLTSKSYWQFTIASAAANAQNTSKLRQAIFGTFGSFAMAPKADLDVLLLKGVGAAYDAKNNIYYTACNATGLPNINLKLGEAPTTRFVSIRPKDYLTPMRVAPNSANCLIGLMPTPTGAHFAFDWYLGVGLVRNYCVMLDAKTPSIMFHPVKK